MVWKERMWKKTHERIRYFINFSRFLAHKWIETKRIESLRNEHSTIKYPLTKWKMELLETLLVCRIDPFECSHWYWAYAIFSAAPHWLTLIWLTYYRTNPDMLNSIGLRMHHLLLWPAGSVINLQKKFQFWKMTHENEWKKKKRNIECNAAKVKYWNEYAHKSKRDRDRERETKPFKIGFMTNEHSNRWTISPNIYHT